LYLAAQKLSTDGQSQIPASLSGLAAFIKTRISRFKEVLRTSKPDYFAPASDLEAARRAAIAKIDSIEAELNNSKGVSVTRIQNAIVELANTTPRAINFIGVTKQFDDCNIQKAHPISQLDIPHLSGLRPPPKITDSRADTQCPLTVTTFSEVPSLTPLEYGEYYNNETKRLAAVSECRRPPPRPRATQPPADSTK
jgi:hypothetical protein